MLSEEKNIFHKLKIRTIAYLNILVNVVCCTLKKDDGEVFQYLLERSRVEYIQEIEELKTVWMNETNEERKERLLKMPAENYETVNDPFRELLSFYN